MELTRGQDTDIKMLSLTNPFRKPFVTGMQPTVPASPTEQTSIQPSVSQPAVAQTSWASRPNEHQLSSLLGACEAGTHAFSHEDFGGQGSWTSDTFRRTSGASSFNVASTDRANAFIQADCRPLQSPTAGAWWMRRRWLRGLSRRDGRSAGRGAGTLTRVGIRGCCICERSVDIMDTRCMRISLVLYVGLSLAIASCHLVTQPTSSPGLLACLLSD